MCTTSLRWLRTNVDEGLLTLKGISVLGKPFNVGELLQQVRAMIGDADDQQSGTVMRGIENHDGPEASLSA
jgi:DNA-binding response OmpR family regulator